MREWWANVYQPDSSYFGHRRETLREAKAMQAPGAICRIHVRLKPEGAPRRYASEVERANWESAPDIMRSLVRERQEADRRRQREREERFIFAAG